MNDCENQSEECISKHCNAKPKRSTIYLRFLFGLRSTCSNRIKQFIWFILRTSFVLIAVSFAFFSWFHTFLSLRFRSLIGRRTLEEEMQIVNDTYNCRRSCIKRLYRNYKFRQAIERAIENGLIGVN